MDYPFTLLVYAFSIQIKFITSDCDAILACVNRQIKYANKSEIVNYKNETEIASQAHWEGVVPKSYQINLKFTDLLNNEGSVDVKFIMVQTTDRIIMINKKKLHPDMDYKINYDHA
jgi:hypothetical protein